MRQALRAEIAWLRTLKLHSSPDALFQGHAKNQIDTIA
jgi:hypothetical protein